MCSGSQKICEWMTMRTRKTSQIFTNCFLWSNGCYFYTVERVDAQSGPGAVGSWCEWLHRNRFHLEFQDVKGCWTTSVSTSPQEFGSKTLSSGAWVMLNSHEFRYDCTDWLPLPIAKKKICIWCRTTWESVSNQILKDHAIGAVPKS